MGDPDTGWDTQVFTGTERFRGCVGVGGLEVGTGARGALDFHLTVIPTEKVSLLDCEARTQTTR